MDQLPNKRTDLKTGERMLCWNLEVKGWEGWMLWAVMLLSLIWKCLQSDGLKKWLVTFSHEPHWNLRTASLCISLFLHTTGWFSKRASPVQVGRRIKTSVQDRKPRRHVGMEDFKHRRAAAWPCPLRRGAYPAFPWEGGGEGRAGLDVV